MKIGIYGGSFNPVHNAHIVLANASIMELNLDKLIIVPTYIQPFKIGAIVAPSNDRINMLNISFDDEKILIDTYEVDDQDISYTIETLDYFKAKYPDDEIIFITGSDSFINIDKWFNGEEILRKYSIAFSKRPGLCDVSYKVDEYIEKFGTTIYELESIMPDISSTSIRNMVKNGEDISLLVPENVNKYILDNGLYTEN